MLDEQKLIADLWRIVERAWRTLATVKDPDARFLGLSEPAMYRNVVRDVREAYGYSSASARSFTPTPEDVSRMEFVMEWMAWLRRQEGEDAIRRMIGRAMGVPVWQLAQRERCSERTIKNRIDRSLAAILWEFYAFAASVAAVDEPEKRRGSMVAEISERPVLSLPDGVTALSVSGIEPGKVYIDGLGYFFRGRKWDDGSARFVNNGHN